jgi:hypothetical protein
MFAAVVLLNACVTPQAGPAKSLDPETGVSLTVVDEPLIFARERRDVAANARDYVTLVAAEFNEAGRRRLVLVSHQWSTVDVRASDFVSVAHTELLIVADGRDLRFAPLPETIAAAFRGNPALAAPEDAHVLTAFYDVDASTLGYIATSRTLTAAYPDSFALPFALWRDGRSAMARLLDDLEIVR